MRGRILLAAAALLLAGLASVPSSQAAPPIYCVMAPCGGEGIDPCAARTLTPTYGLTIYVRDDCSLQVDLKPYDCVWRCSWHTLVQGPPVTVRQFGQDGDATSSSSTPCTCPPPLAVCHEQEVRTSDVLAYMGPHAVVRIDGRCVPSVTIEHIPVPPAAAAAQLPVEVEVVQCVTDPCPPMVRCTTSTSHVGVFQVDRSRSCHLTLTQDPLPCEGTRHEWTTVGPVTVGRSYCGPGIDTAAASIDPFPTCIRECFPVPNEPCELREKTPTTVGPLAIPFNPQDFVWGNDCTIDVEPAYECVGGWGSDHGVAAAFVEVTVRLCGQPLVDWQ